MDWERIMSLAPDELEDEDKEELFSVVAWYDSDGERLARSQLRAVFRIAQELLKYKSEQVEQLVSELDSIAKKEGEERAKRRKMSTDRSFQESPKSDSIKESEHLRTKIRSQSTIIAAQEKQIQALVEQVSDLKKENEELQASVQDVDRDSESLSESAEATMKQQKDLIETVKKKNQQISKLLTSIEKTEEENVVLREKLIEARSELLKATDIINGLNSQFIEFKKSIMEKTEVASDLQDQNTALRSQIQDLVNERNKSEIEMQELTNKLDLRVGQWKKLLDKKDAEIEEWKTRCAKISNQNEITGSGTSMASLYQKLKQREDRLEELQDRLNEATQDMNMAATTIERLKQEKNANLESAERQEIDELKKKLFSAHESCKKLQNQLSGAETDAHQKSKELAEVISQIRKYEEGHYGLSDAIDEIQGLKNKVYIRDKQIAELVQTSNKLQDTCDSLEQQNLAFREKLGLKPDIDIQVTGVVTKHRKQQKLIQKLQAQLELLEEEKISAKLENQKLKNIKLDLEDKLESSGGNKEIAIKDTESKEIVPYEKDAGESGSINYRLKFEELAEENAGLRKGLQEILDSMKNGKDDHYNMRSDTLENLLKSLDMRHIAGWYHPAMRMQAQVHSLQGENIELRNQIKDLKKDTQLPRDSYLAAGDFNTSINIGERHFSLPEDLEPSSAEIISKLNAHLLHALHQYHLNEEKNEKLGQIVQRFRIEYNSTKHQLGIIYKQYITEKLSWQQELKGKADELKTANDNIAVLKTELAEFNGMIKTMNNSSDKARIAELASEVTRFNRKNLYLEESNRKLDSENTKIKNDLLNCRTVVKQKISVLEKTRESLQCKIFILEESLKTYVPHDKLIECSKDLMDLTTKYREIVQFGKSNYFAKEKQETTLMSRELELLHVEKVQLQKELMNEKVKLHNLETVLETPESDDVDIVSMAKKLATSELNEFTERQRADHTNSLYELVKEQLQKSEERIKEVENQNKIILHNNMKLQHLQRELHDKLIHCPDEEEYREMKKMFLQLQEENLKLRAEKRHLMDTNLIIGEKLKAFSLRRTSQDYELIALKHQILDLQAVSDDKAIIGRLGSELVLARLSEAESKTNCENLSTQIERLNERIEEYERRLEDAKKALEVSNHQRIAKCRIMESIIHGLRLQYIGCIPLVAEERFFDSLRQISSEKESSLKELRTAQDHFSEAKTLREQLELQMRAVLELKCLLEQGCKDDYMEKVMAWLRSRNDTQLNELKYRRDLENKTMQLEQFMQRIVKQEEEINKLEMTLFKFQRSQELVPIIVPSQSSLGNALRRSAENIIDETDVLQNGNCLAKRNEEKKEKTFDSKEVQTSYMEEPTSDNSYSDASHTLSSREEFSELRKLNRVKDATIEDLKLRLCDMELKSEATKNQLMEKNMQIQQFEIERSREPNAVDEGMISEITTLKSTVSHLNSIIEQKEETISKYQGLLKEGRDEHSLAAARMQDDMRKLQAVLMNQQKEYQDLKSSVKCSPDAATRRAAIEHYIMQTQELEHHLNDLQTSNVGLGSQLQASRQEAVRWRTLAHDRLESIDKIRKELEGQHQVELVVYKSECEKWREEASRLKNELTKVRVELSHGGAAFIKKLEEKENKIHELQQMINKLKLESKRSPPEPKQMSPSTGKDWEDAKKKLEEENEALRKQFDQLLNRERIAREEIRNLKGQLIKRPQLSSRSEKSLDKPSREQLQKKITSLESELEEVQLKLEKELSLNEMHRTRRENNFNYWTKLKKSQQTADKLKSKLKIKTDEMEKLRSSYEGLRTVISRLDREKHVLESRLRCSKSTSSILGSVQMESMEMENNKLRTEIAELETKLEMHQHHSGGLGAVMLHEKLEAQERKIAVLELSSKSSQEVTAEIERLQSTVASLQKSNLRLEAENLDLRLDLEKYTTDVPHLREQVQHLEKYITVLKEENSKLLVGAGGDACKVEINHSDSSKKCAELEKTVFVLKRVVEKLQAENKRLQSSRQYANPERRVSTMRVNVEVQKLKNQLKEAQEKLSESEVQRKKLEEDLTSARSRIAVLQAMEQPGPSRDSSKLEQEMKKLREQLLQKSTLLDRVKVLLHKAAAKEKDLQDQVSSLRLLVPAESSQSSSD